VDLNLSTFLLEIVNFLVLVWILKRFLYQPVLDIIARRRAMVEKSMSDAKQVESEARELQERYQGRLADWEAEQAEARKALANELESERANRLAELRSTLEKERRKMHVAERQKLADLRESDERRALSLGARFASRLLEDASSETLQSKLVARLLADLESMTPKQFTRLLGNPDRPPQRVLVTSAYPLTEKEQDSLGACLGKLATPEVPVLYEQDPALLAGVRITAGDCVLGLNLQDELEGFARLSDGHG
jgi:F-type H+-transporting ATPase subunit b